MLYINNTYSCNKYYNKYNYSIDISNIVNSFNENAYINMINIMIKYKKDNKYIFHSIQF